MQGLIEHIDNLTTHLSKLSDPRVDRTIKNIEQLKTRAENTVLKVGVVGEFKAGKSTLLNAILGEEILPTGVSECTALPICMRYGLSPKFIAVDGNGKETIINDKEEWRNLGALDLKNNQNQQVVFKKLIYECPHPLLEKKVEIYDTPGLGSSTEELHSLSRQFIKDMDAVMYVVRVSMNPFNKRESMLISEFLEKKEFSKILFIMNGIDEIRDSRDGNFEATMQAQYNRLKDLTGLAQPRIASISAADALWDIKNRAMPNKDTGFSELLIAMDDLIFSHSFEILHDSLKIRINKEIKEIREDLSLKLEHDLLKNDQIKLKAQHLEQTISSRKEFTAQLMREINVQFSDWENHIPSLIDQHYKSSVAACNKKCESANQESLKAEDVDDWIKKEISYWIENLNKAWLNRDSEIKNLIISRLNILQNEFAELMDSIQKTTGSTSQIKLSDTVNTSAHFSKRSWEEVEDVYEKQINKESQASNILLGSGAGMVLGALFLICFPPAGIAAMAIGTGTILGSGLLGAGVGTMQDNNWAKVKTGVRKILKTKVKVDFEELLHKQKSDCQGILVRVTRAKKEELLGKAKIAVEDKIADLEGRLSFIFQEKIDTEKLKSILKNINEY